MAQTFKRGGHNRTLNCEARKARKLYVLLTAIDSFGQKLFTRKQLRSHLESLDYEWGHSYVQYMAQLKAMLLIIDTRPGGKTSDLYAITQLAPLYLSDKWKPLQKRGSK